MGKSRSGFILIELAVVIIVIGLIIGGILVSKSMFAAVRMQNTIRQTAQFDVAITNYKTKYKYMPGDSPSFQFEAGGQGNANGMVEDNSGTPGLGRRWEGEVANFWPELNHDGLKSPAPYNACIN